MISFINDCQEIPYLIFKEKYNEAIKKNQSFIEAMAITSFSIKNNEVDSRFVNLKIVDSKSFIFFTNYLSPKAFDFDEHPQVSLSFFWDTTNTQIRIKATIKKTSLKYNNQYFKGRSKEKNILAICSNQSSEIDSYDLIKKKYEKTLKEKKIEDCPDYWGGYACIPYYFEFWTGHKHRINIREAYSKNGYKWKKAILEP